MKSRHIAFVAVLSCLAPARAADWDEFKAGPFQVITDASDRQAQDRLAELEQLRHVLGTVLGTQDPTTVWPVRVVVFKNPKQYDSYAAVAGLGLSRAGLIGALQANAPAPRSFMRELSRIIINENATGRMPATIENGLADFYATIQVDGSKVTVSDLPPAADRNRDWARIHLLSVDPAYYGKMRVLLFNLQKGVDMDPAFRNAFGKDPKQIEKQLDEHIANGYPGSASFSGLPINPRRDFKRADAASAAADLALADLLFKDAAHAAQARAAYEAILKKSPDNTQAEEGLGLLAAREKREADAKQFLDAAVKAGSTNARVWLEYAKLEHKRDALAKAASLTPRYTDIYREMAAEAPDSAHRVQAWKAASKAEPRNAANWRALAEAYIEREEYADAAKAWTSAERAAATDEERTHIQQRQKWIQEKRVEYEHAERQRALDEQAADLQRAKDNAMAEVHAAEERANRAAAQRPKDEQQIVQGGEAPAGKVEGRLTAVTCGPHVRISVRDQRNKLIRLLIADPRKVVVKNGGTLDFTCGVQRKQRTVVVEYYEKRDARLGTAGEVATIEYK